MMYSKIHCTTKIIEMLEKEGHKILRIEPNTEVRMLGYSIDYVIVDELIQQYDPMKKK